MPNSSTLGKNTIKEWFDKQTDITRILDVGCGVGTYPRLLGDKYYWIGIEVWEPYIEKYNLKSLYKEIIVGDVQDIALPDVDCAILGDVVEHFTKVDGLFLLTKIRDKYKHVIVSIPIGEYEQGAIEGNPHEEHKSIWYFDDLLSLLNPSVSKINFFDDGSNRAVGVFIK
jgi:SAM-dependent methyltransferase